MGVNACSVFVTPPDFQHLVDHIDHIVKIGGIETAGLGPDFADYLLRYKPELERNQPSQKGLIPVKGYDGDEDFSKIADELARRGYKASIERVMGENFLRVFKMRPMRRFFFSRSRKMCCWN